MTLSAAGLHILICAGSASMGREDLANDSGSLSTTALGSIVSRPCQARRGAMTNSGSAIVNRLFLA